MYLVVISILAQGMGLIFLTRGLLFIMKRCVPYEETILAINLDGCSSGPVLSPMEPRSEKTHSYFSDWETPLAPWGGFNLESHLEIVEEGKERILVINANTGGRVQERALVSRTADYRDGHLRARLQGLGVRAEPHMDNNEVSAALVGLCFRMVNSRWYYQFALEGQRQAVLYCRRDEEWRLLAAQDVKLTGGFVDLNIYLDGDAIICQCAELNVDFRVTDTTYKRGRVGVRALGEAQLASLIFSQTEGQQEATGRYQAQMRMALALRGQEVSDPVLVHTLDYEMLGGTPRFMDFIEPGRYDMLIAGKTLRAASVSGQTLWEMDVPVQGIVCSKEHGKHGRLLYGFMGL